MHLYDEVQILLATVAPHGVIRFIEGLQRDSSGSASGVAFTVGLIGALWAATGAMGTIVKAVNRAFDCTETRNMLRVRLTALFLVMLTALTMSATVVLIVFGGPLGSAIARKAHLGSAWDIAWGILRWPVMLAALVTFFALVYHLAPNVQEEVEVDHARRRRRLAALARALRPVRAVHQASAARTRARTARSPRE